MAERIMVSFDKEAVFADLERGKQGRTTGVSVADNCDFISILAYRKDGSISMTAVEIPKSAAGKMAAALLELSGEMLPFKLRDAFDENRPGLSGWLNVTDLGVGVHFDGFGDAPTEDGFGEPVFMEVQHGVPIVHVWDDITQDEARFHISLEDAAESKRPPESV